MNPVKPKTDNPSDHPQTAPAPLMNAPAVAAPPPAMHQPPPEALRSPVKTPRENIDYSQVPIIHTAEVQAAGDDEMFRVFEVTDKKTTGVVAVVVGATDTTGAMSEVVSNMGLDPSRRPLASAEYPRGTKRQVQEWMRPGNVAPAPLALTEAPAPVQSQSLPNAEPGATLPGGHKPPPPAHDPPVVERAPDSAVPENQMPVTNQQGGPVATAPVVMPEPAKDAKAEKADHDKKPEADEKPPAASTPHKTGDKVKHPPHHK